MPPAALQGVDCFCSILYLRVSLICWAVKYRTLYSTLHLVCLPVLPGYRSVFPLRLALVPSGPACCWCFFCSDSASSCSTIGNLHEAQSQALPARRSADGGQVESQSMQLHGARSARRDKHRTHSFTFDVIATALQVASVVHSRLLVLFIAKLSLFLGRPWPARTSNSQMSTASSTGTGSWDQLPNVAAGRSHKRVHTWRPDVAAVCTEVHWENGDFCFPVCALRMCLPRDLSMSALGPATATAAAPARRPSSALCGR